MFRRLLLTLPLLALLSGLLLVHSSSHVQADANFQNVPSASANVHLALLFNYHLANKSVESGKVDYVWGAQAKVNTVATNDPAPGVAHTYYTMFTEADEHASLAWFEANHPDWLVYKCDRSSVAMVGNQIPLDVTNPAVQAFELQWITQAMDGGYQGVGFDNTTTYNFFAKCGHFDSSGAWVQQFSGKHVDLAYRQALTTAFHQLTDRVRAAAAARGIPFYITINGGPNLWENQAAWYDLLPYLDFVVDEDGFTNGGYSSNNRLTSDATDSVANAWLTKMQEFQYLQNTLGKGLILAAQEPYQVNTAASAPESDVQWVLANYLMARSSHAYQALITGNQQYGGLLTIPPAYRVAIGAPAGPMYSAQGVYLRNYSNGLVIVNPSARYSHSVSLPPGRFHDLFGRPVSDAISLAAGGSSVVLVRDQSSTAQLKRNLTRDHARRGHQLLRNSRFALGMHRWQVITFGSRRRGRTARAFQITRYGTRLCGYTHCGTEIRQAVRLPVHFGSVVLTYSVQVQPGRLAARGHDHMLIQLRNTHGAPIVTYIVRSSTVRRHGWIYHSVELAPSLNAYHGKSIQISLRAFTGSGHTRFTVGGLALRVARAHR